MVIADGKSCTSHFQCILCRFIVMRILPTPIITIGILSTKMIKTWNIPWIYQDFTWSLPNKSIKHPFHS
jgi:hypothetical protein